MSATSIRIWSATRSARLNPVLDIIHFPWPPGALAGTFAVAVTTIRLGTGRSQLPDYSGSGSAPGPTPDSRAGRRLPHRPAPARPSAINPARRPQPRTGWISHAADPSRSTGPAACSSATDCPEWTIRSCRARRWCSRSDRLRPQSFAAILSIA